MDKHKRAEFVVSAESTWGVARGVSLAIQKIDAGIMVGKDSIPRHGVSVEWRVIDVVGATDVLSESILPHDAPPPPAVNTPDITIMDIEEAKGMVGTAGSESELDDIEMFEKSGSRVPGGRKGVLDYIEKRRAEFKAIAAEKAAKESAKEPSEADGDDEPPSTAAAPHRRKKA